MAKRRRTEEQHVPRITDEAAKEHGTQFSIEGEEEIITSSLYSRKIYHLDGMLSDSRREKMAKEYEAGAKAWLSHDVDAAIEHLTRARTMRNTERDEKQKYEQGLKPLTDRNVMPGAKAMIVLEEGDQRDIEVSKLHGQVVRIVCEVGTCLRIEFADGKQGDMWAGNLRLYKNKPGVDFKYQMKKRGE